MTENKVQDCPTIDVWRSKLKDAKINGTLTVVIFTASWCRQNRGIDNLFGDLANQFNGTQFLKVDVSKLQEVSTELDVTAVPTFMFIKDGKPVEKMTGGKKAEFEEKLKKYSEDSFLNSFYW